MTATAAPAPDDEPIDVMIRDRRTGAPWRRLAVVRGYGAAVALTADVKRVEVWLRTAKRKPQDVPKTPTLFDES